MLGFFARSGARGVVDAGAITASMNVEVMALAVSTSIGRLRPTMPPNAASASASRARTYASAADAAGRRAARVGVLDDGGGRLGELEHDARGRVEVEQVGERQLLALQDVHRAKARRARAPYQAAFWCGFSP